MLYVLCKENRKARFRPGLCASPEVPHAMQVKLGRIYSVRNKDDRHYYYCGIYWSWPKRLFDVIADDDDLLSVIKMYNTKKKVRALP